MMMKFMVPYSIDNYLPGCKTQNLISNFYQKGCAKFTVFTELLQADVFIRDHSMPLVCKNS